MVVYAGKDLWKLSDLQSSVGLYILKPYSVLHQTSLGAAKMSLQYFQLGRFYHAFEESPRTFSISEFLFLILR